MQETGAVGWDPVYERHLPLSSKLFILYIVSVTIVSLVKWTRLLRQLRWLKRHSQAAEPQRTSVRLAGLETIQSSKRLVILTCLLSGAVTRNPGSCSVVGKGIPTILRQRMDEWRTGVGYRQPSIRTVGEYSDVRRLCFLRASAGAARSLG